jgi:hypothetical protein
MPLDETEENDSNVNTSRYIETAELARELNLAAFDHPITVKLNRYLHGLEVV